MRKIEVAASDDAFTNMKATKGLLPDAQDKKNIQHLLRQFEVAFPGMIAWCINSSRAETTYARKPGSVITQKEGQMNLGRRFSMPQPLLLELKKAYPMLIADRRQFEWFLRNFPQFDLMK